MSRLVVANQKAHRQTDRHRIKSYTFLYFKHIKVILSRPYAGADPGFQVRGGGAHLKKLRRAEGGAKIFGVFRVKNHDFTPKNHIFPILGGPREIFGVFHVKNHDFTPKKSYFFQFYGGSAPGTICS